MSKTRIFGFLAMAAAVFLLAACIPARADDGEKLKPYASAKDLDAWRTYLENGGDVERPDKVGNSALIQAASYGNTALCEMLIAHGADVNYAGYKKHTPLMKATYGSRERCEQLIRHGAKIDAVDEDGDAVVFHQHELKPDVVKLFLEHGVDVNIRNGKSETLLMLAAQKSPETLRILLDAGADTEVKNKAEDHNAGWAAIHYAVQACNAENVQILLDAGADVNAKTDSGMTPLYLCASWFPVKMDMLETLLAGGADVNLGPGDERAPVALRRAMTFGSADAAMRLLEAGSDIKQIKLPLFQAAQTFSRPLMERMIELGEDIHVRNESAETLMMTVAELGDIPLAQWLLEMGLDINASSRDGKTAVMKALDEEHGDMVRFLVENGAKVEDDPENKKRHGNAGRHDGASSLKGVVERGDLPMARYLVRHGARFLDEPEDEKKLLHYAVESQNREMCEYILNFNGDVNVQDKEGNTPLHYAAERANYDLCVLLLSRGAKVDAKNKRNETPLMRMLAGELYGLSAVGPQMRVRVWQLLTDAGAEEDVDAVLKRMPRSNFLTRYIEFSTGNYRDAKRPESLFVAAQEGDADRIARLLEAGQDVNRKDPDGETAIHFAVRAGKTETVAFLLDKGADIESPGFRGGTPLHYAAALGHVEIIDLLTDRGAKLDSLTTVEYQTPLAWAVAASHGPCAIALVKHGADPGWRGINWASHHVPFVLAMRMGKEPYCKFFCQQGFNWEQYVREVKHYLWYSNGLITPAGIRILAACGQNLNAADKDGNTLLHYTVEYNKPVLTRTLVELGADPTVKNVKGNLPADLIPERTRSEAERRVLAKALGMENGIWRMKNE